MSEVPLYSVRLIRSLKSAGAEREVEDQLVEAVDLHCGSGLRV